ncbi:hypothetical protein C9I50_11055 [Pseudomonas prosekii]|nr:hypothetical protein C9I50_11055 [Pseudomonas prosekii]
MNPALWEQSLLAHKPSPVGAKLARDDDFKDAIASKLCSHRAMAISKPPSPASLAPAKAW